MNAIGRTEKAEGFLERADEEKDMVKWMEKRNGRPEIDFVPEDNEWMPDESPEIWEGAEEEDMERTVVLKPVDEDFYGRRSDGDFYEDEEEPEGNRMKRSPRRKPAGPAKPSYLKYGRDPYDNLEEEPGTWPAEPDIWAVECGSRGSAERTPGAERSGRAERSRGVDQIRETGRARGTGRTAGAAAGRAWWHRPILLRLISLALMVVLLAGLGKAFWAGLGSMGSVLSAAEEGNYGGLLYLLLAGSTMAWGAVALLWMLSRRRVYRDGRLKRMDVGRGVTPFLSFALLVFVSARLALRLPEDSWFFDGLSRYFLAAASAGPLVYVCGGAGVVSCILRKFVN